MQGFNGKCLFKQVDFNWKIRINSNKLKREHIHIMKNKLKNWNKTNYQMTLRYNLNYNIESLVHKSTL
jgi:hypothetical protein